MTLNNIKIKQQKATDKIQELRNIANRQKKNKEKQALEESKVKRLRKKGQKV